jgi:hypothetical protein
MHKCVAAHVLEVYAILWATVSIRDRPAQIVVVQHMDIVMIVIVGEMIIFVETRLMVGDVLMINAPN